jgi:hypothetical protein
MQSLIHRVDWVLAFWVGLMAVAAVIVYGLWWRRAVGGIEGQRAALLDGGLRSGPANGRLAEPDSRTTSRSLKLPA